MKPRKPLPIPQHEFVFTPNTFTLFSETGVDGERTTREREQAEQPDADPQARWHRSRERNRPGDPIRRVQAH